MAKRVDVAELEGGAWIAASKAAREIEKSATWVRQLVHRGQLEAISTDVGLVISRRSIAAYLAEREGAA